MLEFQVREGAVVPFAPALNLDSDHVENLKRLATSLWL